MSLDFSVDPGGHPVPRCSAWPPQQLLVRRCRRRAVCDPLDEALLKQRPERGCCPAGDLTGDLTVAPFDPPSIATARWAWCPAGRRPGAH